MLQELKTLPHDHEVLDTKGLNFSLQHLIKWAARFGRHARGHIKYYNKHYIHSGPSGLEFFFFLEIENLALGLTSLHKKLAKITLYVTNCIILWMTMAVHFDYHKRKMQ